MGCGARTRPDLLGALLVAVVLQGCKNDVDSQPVGASSRTAIVRYRDDSGACGTRLLSPISGARWRADCRVVSLRGDTLCPAIRAQVAALWFAPRMSGCIYPGSGELLLHEDGQLIERLQFVDTLGTILHFWPCMRVGISVAVSEASGAKLLRYRVLRFGSAVQVLHEFGAGQLSAPAVGLSEIAEPQQLLVASADSTSLLVATSGSLEVFIARSSACARDGAVLTSATIPIHLDVGASAETARTPLAVSRKLAFVEPEETGLVVGTISRERMELWICPQQSVCTRRSSLRSPELTVASFLCDKSICSIVQSHRDSLLILRQRIE